MVATFNPVLASLNDSAINRTADINFDNTFGISIDDALGVPVDILKLDGNDDLFIGDATGVDNMVFDVATSGIFSFDVNGTPIVVFQNSGRIVAVDIIPSGTTALSIGAGTIYNKNRIDIGNLTEYFIQTRNHSADAATVDINVIAQAALAAAVTNLDGGNLNLTGGAGASGSAGDADGGSVVLRGGASFGTGTNGGIDIGGASDLVGFYGTSPIALQTGVAVSAGGVHAALVNLGLITA